MKTEQPGTMQQVPGKTHVAAGVLSAPKRLTAVLLVMFSVTLTLAWPLLALGRYGDIFWWNGWVLFTCLGMVALSSSRLFGAQQAFALPEAVFGLIMARGLNWFLTYVRPSGKVAAVDELLLAFDAKVFGRNAGFVLGKLFVRYPLPGIFFVLAHKALPLALALTYLALPNSKQVRRQYCMLIALAAVIIFGVMYGLCPGAGPIYAFATEFPFEVPTLAQPHARIIANAALNTTPSGHLAWALLMYWFVRKHCTSKVTLWMSGGFVFATAVATMGTGEHYWIDLILALPFAAGIWELTWRRWRAAAFCLSLVALWEIALQTGWALRPPAGAIWAALSATAIVPFLPRRNVRAAG